MLTESLLASSAWTAGASPSTIEIDSSNAKNSESF
jgi:hypothetical protein